MSEFCVLVTQERGQVPMITLNYPSTENQKYLTAWGLLFGPLGSDYKLAVDTIPFDGSISSMSESKGIWGENGVLHTKISGSVMYHPIVEYAIPRPDANYPHKLCIPVKETPFEYAASFGIAVDRGTCIGALASNTIQIATQYDSATKTWIVWHITFLSTSPNQIYNLIQYRLPTDWITTPDSAGHCVSKYYTKSASRSSEYRSIVVAGRTLMSFDWWEEQINTQIHTWSTELVGTNSVAHLHTADPTRIRTVSEAKAAVDKLSYAFFPNGFPLEDMHYGELAMKALEKKRVMSNNMLEFLKDVPRLHELIPTLVNLRKTLKNLKSVKGVASEFLKVKYGVLPTISDLNAIVDGFKRQKPWTDKFGFEYFKSGHTASCSQSSLDFELSQFIKIGVDTEDSKFQELYQNLDSLGLFPSLENIWDLVKYSFVVDWFVDVGGFLERVDTRMRIMSYNIRYATMSKKRVCRGFSSYSAQYPFCGYIQWEEYHRWVSSQSPLPPLALQFNQLTGEKFLIGSALLIQRKR